MPTPELRKGLVLALLLLTVGATSLTAEWLVTPNGERVTIRGAWEVRGEAIVFTLPSGALGSLRSDEVDLEATRALAAELASGPERAAARPEARKSPVLVVTDADMPRRRTAEPRAADPSAGTDEPRSEGRSASEGAPSSAVEVVRWGRDGTFGELGFRIEGVARNNGMNLALEPRVTVSLFDEEERLLVSRSVPLRVSSLTPGAAGAFAAEFDDLVDDFARVEFDVTSFEMVLRDETALRNLEQ